MNMPAKSNPCDKCEPVGTREIAELLGVQHNTVSMWGKRDRLPPSRGYISGNPWWWKTDIEAWGQETGRWPRRESVKPPAQG